MIRVSQSQIKTWRRCEKQWWFKYIKNLEARRPTRARRFGSVMHDLLAHHYRGKDALKLLNRMAEADPEYGEVEVESMYTAVEGNFIEYMAHYQEEGDYDVVAVEEHFQVRLPEPYDNFLLEGYFDGIFSDGDGTWLVEHKTGKQDSPTDMRFWDLQSMIYQWAWKQLNPGTPLRGTMWNYITSSALQPPYILASGKPSRAKSQNTTWRLYYPMIIKYGENPEHYEDIREMLEAKEQQYFSRTFLPNDPDVELLLINDLLETLGVLFGGYTNPDYHFVRNLDRHCTWCDYQPLCHLELLTGDFEDAISPDYVPRKKAEEKRSKRKVSKARRSKNSNERGAVRSKQQR